MSVIYVLVGSNAYMRQQELARIVGAREDIFYVDGEDLSEARLIDLIAGQSLFGVPAVVIRSMSENTILWQTIDTWITRVQEDRILVLTELSLDKRTKSYKILKQHATIIDIPEWSERHTTDAAEWLVGLAKKLAVRLTSEQVSSMIARATHADASGKAYIDQMELYQAMYGLRGLEGVVDDALIDTILPRNTYESSYELMGTALSGDAARTTEVLDSLRQSDDPFRVFALLVSQWESYCALATTHESPQMVAADIGVHPYVLQKLTPYRHALTLEQLRILSSRLAHVDMTMKTSSVDPWYGTERFIAELILAVKE